VNGARVDAVVHRVELSTHIGRRADQQKRVGQCCCPRTAAAKAVWQTAERGATEASATPTTEPARRSRPRRNMQPVRCIPRRGGRFRGKECGCALYGALPVQGGSGGDQTATSEGAPTVTVNSRKG
jgi:hypothetical protein